MNTITIKATLVASPVPPAAPSTRIAVRVAAGDTMTIASLNLAAGHPLVTVTWGDGMTTSAPGGKFAHTYTSNGEYAIVISDDVQSLCVVGTDEAAIASAPLIVGFTTDAQLLTQLNSRAFEGCVNLSNPMLEAAKLDTLLPATFGMCLSLSGVLRFPSVASIPGPGTLQPFVGCKGGITEIHFAIFSEESIKSSKAYGKDPTLGTGTAVLIFDL